MKSRKATIIIGTLITAAIVLGIFNWKTKRWPFATGTTIPVFLGTTFEMSLPEAQRALNKYNVQLENKSTFKANHPHIAKNNEWVFYFLALKDNSMTKYETLYLPPIEMFNSRLFGTFNFIDNKLISATLFVDPHKELLNKESNSAIHEKVIKNIIDMLNKRYTMAETIKSKEIPGAYTQVFHGNGVNIRLWVNLTEQFTPRITIFIIYPKLDANRKNKIKEMEKNAF